MTSRITQRQISKTRLARHAARAARLNHVATHGRTAQKRRTYAKAFQWKVQRIEALTSPKEARRLVKAAITKLEAA